MSTARKSQPVVFYRTEELMRLTYAKFGAPEFAFLEQVRNGTGYARSPRTADALAMGLWPSRGVYLHGFEVKRERNDWLRELKAPEKAEEVCGYCDYWWIVAAPGVVIDGELPPTWGLLEPDEKRKALVNVKAAPLLTAKPMDRQFLAAILRRVAETSVPTAEVETRVAKEIEAQTSGLKHHYERQIERFRQLDDAVAAFERESGISIRSDQWKLRAMAQAVRTVMTFGAETLLRQLQNFRDELLRTAANIETALSTEEIREKKWERADGIKHGHPTLPGPSPLPTQPCEPEV